MKKVNYWWLLRICLLIVLLLPISLSGQTRYSCKLLQEIAGQLASSYGIRVEQAGELQIDAISTDKPLYAKQTESGVINHIGIRLFGQEVMEGKHAIIFHFIERYLLELLLADTDAVAQNRLQQERVSFSSDLCMSGMLRKDICTIVSAFSPGISFFLDHANNRYMLKCMCGQQTIMSLEFPARYELITGYTKLEAENAVYMELLCHKLQSPIATGDLFEKREGIYVANDDYYMMESIVSAVFYEKEGDTFHPIFSQGALAESVCNLFNSGADYGVIAEVTQSLYGNKSNTYEVPLVQLTDYLRSQDCRVYTAVQRMEANRIYGALMAVNSDLGYQHVFTFTLDKSWIPDIKEKQIKMKMFSYVPIHNLSSIMGNK